MLNLSAYTITSYDEDLKCCFSIIYQVQIILNKIDLQLKLKVTTLINKGFFTEILYLVNHYFFAVWCIPKYNIYFNRSTTLFAHVCQYIKKLVVTRKWAKKHYINNDLYFWRFVYTQAKFSFGFFFGSFKH